MTTNDNPKQKHVPREITRLLEDMTTNHEKNIRSQEGSLPRPLLHGALVGYYTGILQILTVIGYEDDRDPTLAVLVHLRDLHAHLKWPEDTYVPPKGDTPT